MSHTTTKIVIARQDGSVLGQYVLGAGEHLIGREIDAAIYIDDPSVSRAHARLFISGDIVEIEDLQSTSGTYVDGVAVRGLRNVALPADEAAQVCGPPPPGEPRIDAYEAAWAIWDGGPRAPSWATLGIRLGPWAPLLPLVADLGGLQASP